MTIDTGHEVLLTGATGFVGKVVLEALLRRRIEERVQCHRNPQRAGAEIEQHENEPDEDDLHRLLPALIVKELYDPHIVSRRQRGGQRNRVKDSL